MVGGLRLEWEGGGGESQTAIESGNWTLAKWLGAKPSGCKKMWRALGGGRERVQRDGQGLPEGVRARAPTRSIGYNCTDNRRELGRGLTRPLERIEAEGKADPCLPGLRV
jgi:hypothetical protein|uniref:Uncharacterized protein n=1 Tax=Eutreptiella gymnastica TaxID=73025 RepID=A0A7S4G319_9EUGL